MCSSPSDVHNYQLHVITIEIVVAVFVSSGPLFPFCSIVTVKCHRNGQKRATSQMLICCIIRSYSAFRPGGKVSSFPRTFCLAILSMFWHTKATQRNVPSAFDVNRFNTSSCVCLSYLFSLASWDTLSCMKVSTATYTDSALSLRLNFI
jgi:hypothetical protein